MSPCDQDQDSWSSIPLNPIGFLSYFAGLRLRGFSLSMRGRSRATASSIKPVGPGRCIEVYGTSITTRDKAFKTNNDTVDEVLKLESWHMLDSMVSAEFSCSRGQRVRHHWLKHRMASHDWYTLRRWLLWSGRRVEAIGQRASTETDSVLRSGKSSDSRPSAQAGSSQNP